jgi:hypothetical protein
MLADALPPEGLPVEPSPIGIARRRLLSGRVCRVLCVKFCKGGHGWLESCGLAELNFLVLFEIVHIEIAMGFEPVLVGLDG